MKVHKLLRKVYAKTICFEDDGEFIDAGYNGFSATPYTVEHPMTFVQFDAGISASEACAALDRIKEAIAEADFPERVFALEPDKAAFLLKEEAKVDFVPCYALYLYRDLDA